MKQCPDCGYQLDDFDVCCPRCARFGPPLQAPPPVAPVPVTPPPAWPSAPPAPQPGPVLPAPVLGQEFIGRGSRAGGLLFLLPAFACFLPALFLGMPGGGLMESAIAIAVFGFPIAVVGGSLGAYYALETDAFWGNFGKGMAGAGAWIMFLRLMGSGRSAMDMNGPFLMAFVTSAVVFGVGCYAGSTRVQRGFDNGDVPLGKIVASAGACFVPLLGFWLTWNYWQNDDEKAPAAAGGLALNLWAGGVMILLQVLEAVLRQASHR